MVATIEELREELARLEERYYQIAGSLNVVDEVAWHRHLQMYEDEIREMRKQLGAT